MTSHYFHPVPGSAALRTVALGRDPSVVRVEALQPGKFERHLVQGEPLGRVVVRDAFVAVLVSIFDELAAQQSIIEQVLYLQLYRHSFGEDRNYCRLARRELCQRTGLSSRRFNCALAGLVRKGHVRLLQRDRKGTLYRVLLPSEIASGHTGDEVMLGKLRQATTSPDTRSALAAPAVLVTGADGPEKEQAARPRSGPRAPAQVEENNRYHKMTSKAKTEEAPAATRVIPQRQMPSVGQVVESVLLKLPQRRRAQVAQDVLQDVLELLEEGEDLNSLGQHAAHFVAPRGQAAAEFGRFVRARSKTSGAN
ncbi:MAG: hypothetical protein ABIJ09_22345 [Pseudomonadota bacterium]